MSLLIKNGRVVTADSDFHADIYCEDETITRIGKNLEAPSGAEVIDAAGKLVFPGFIDPHVHIYLPFMGTFSRDDYVSGSKAALVGGTTTLIEMCCPSRADEALESFELWMSQAEGKSACDFTFHMGVTKFDSGTESQLREIVARGNSSFKIFLAYKGAFGIDDTELYQTLKLARELGVIVTAHCENETLIAERQRGVRVSIETLIQYLLLDKTDAERPNFEGAKFVMSPPLRDKRNQPVLWGGLASGLVQTVATDHAPFDFATQKPMGRDDFTKIPNGIPSLEERVKLLYTYGVKSGKLDLSTFVNVASTQAAKLFGLFPRKGTIAVGSDADLVVFDPDYRGSISAATQAMAVDYSAFEGWQIEGRPSVVTVRGEIAVRDGKFVGTLGRGKYLARPAGH